MTHDAPWLVDSPPAVMVESATGEVPFMAGIMVHWLLLRGVPFEPAYAAARQVERRIAGRDRVTRRELAQLLEEALPGDRRPAGLDGTVDVQVKGGVAALPFSKGVLSQSLLATAIEPVAAFAVAREIEAKLLASHTGEITRRELRDLACQVLRRRVGDEAAERYQLWRAYQEPERPVVLLLGGTSGVGKTAVALEVARRLDVGRVLSTDSIRQMMRLMLSAEFVPAIHGSSYDAYRWLPFEDGRPPSVLAGFHAQAQVVAVGVRASLDRTISESANLVIDGVSVVPGLIDLEAYAAHADVVHLLIATLDEEVLRNRFIARATGQRRRLPDRYLESLEGILEIQRHLIELAGRHRVPIIDNASFDETVRAVIDHVMHALRERRAPGGVGGC